MRRRRDLHEATPSGHYDTFDRLLKSMAAIGKLLKSVAATAILFKNVATIGRLFISLPKMMKTMQDLRANIFDLGRSA